ncbi:glycosyltransferase family 2 protein [Nonomuraea turkmeniaca]|uniref:glycosyltransferase family 2 protein n=1 Tax=Nonomuraea turkmeniaca TaxID=103838 RepID=UPI001FEC0923|nr:glycosyltransferase [Nonomuraea turkmeniaca]
MITVVIPTIGRPTLADTLAAVGSEVPVIVVDDRVTDRDQTGTLRRGGGSRTKERGVTLSALSRFEHVRVVRSGGRGPAAARNAGWRAAETPWVVFLDDDVIPQPGWAAAVWKDLVDLPEDVAGSQGRIVVPPPSGRRPTDAERNTAGLADALWVTADMAYRRSVLEAAGGFDERFPRAYREDADLALRVARAGHRLVRGDRVTAHPVRQDGFWASVRFQRGNADDALMRRVHGRGWRAAVGGGRGRLRTHAVTTAAGLAALTLAALSARRTLPATRRAAVLAGLVWAGLTAEFAWRRITPGPRTPDEVWRMVVTSLVIPPVACAHRLRGEWRVRR